jgi:hypothetical protein
MLGCHRDLFGDGPHKGDELPGNSHHDLLSVFPPCAQLSVALAEPYLRLPADILYGFGELVQASLQVTTDFRRITVRPGAFDECVSSLGVPRLGDRALTPPLTTGVFRGGQAQGTHELSGVVNARPIPEFCDDGDGDDKLHAPQGLKGFDHRLKTPGVHLLVKCLFETWQAFSVLVHRPDIFLEDELLRRGRTDDFREPAPGGRPPGGLARIAAILPEQTRVEPELGGLEIPDSIFTRPAQLAEGFVCDLGNIDGREVPRAHESRQLDGVTTVGFDPGARRFRTQRRGDDPARLSCFTQVAIEPIPARAGFIDKDQVLTFRLQLTNEWIDGTLTRANGPERGDLSPLILSDIRHRDGFFMDIQTNVEGVRVCHG